MRVVQHHSAVKRQSSDCRRVKWCPCMLDDDDDVSADDVGKLLVVTDSRTVSSFITLRSFGVGLSKSRLGFKSRFGHFGGLIQ